MVSNTYLATDYFSEVDAVDHVKNTIGQKSVPKLIVGTFS